MQQALFAIGQDVKQHIDDQMLTGGAFKGVILVDYHCICVRNDCCSYEDTQIVFIHFE